MSAQTSVERLEEEISRLLVDRDHFRQLATHQQRLRQEPDGCERDVKHDQQVERLKSHLLAVEEQYTQEITELINNQEQCQTKIASLEQRLQLQARAQHSVKVLESERDSLAARLSQSEDRAQQYSASINNLQLVIEQIQKENERKLQSQRDKCLEQLREEQERSREREARVQSLEQSVQESCEALGAAQRLSLSIDLKSEEIERLRRTVEAKEKSCEELREEVNELKDREDSKVDKQVIKGLLIGLFVSPEDRKHEVKRLLARILDFNQKEMERTGIQIGRKKAPSAEESLSEKFVKFLENESKRDAKSGSAAGVDQQLARDLIHDKRNPFLSEDRKSSDFFNSILIQKK